MSNVYFNNIFTMAKYSRKKTSRKGKDKPRKKPDQRKDKIKPIALKHIDFLNLLGATRHKKKRSLLIDYANKEQLDAIAECVQNILHGIVPLSDLQKQKLIRYRNTMRALTLANLPLTQRRRTLVQSGGFLGSLIPIAVSALSSIFGPLFKSK